MVLFPLPFLAIVQQLQEPQLNLLVSRNDLRVSEKTYLIIVYLLWSTYCNPSSYRDIKTDGSNKAHSALNEILGLSCPPPFGEDQKSEAKLSRLLETNIPETSS